MLKNKFNWCEMEGGAGVCFFVCTGMFVCVCVCARGGGGGGLDSFFFSCVLGCLCVRGTRACFFVLHEKGANENCTNIIVIDRPLRQAEQTT